ncbi:zf-HC2 domain-containing protein [Mucilaginibacter sp.]|uniref:zf-HC2 domain-containing protein n=1 Tax=Mucilaginibacter sp. TaxID=1882438 RepID=UPI002605EFAC|nr:zf-HC2 domain-containing protein [Mucilaginibacter sp.]MDB4923551.1 repeat protein [Mucilaginibacter sp.]
MIKCEKYKERLADWHMGRLESVDAAELEQHLNACADCREALAATGFVLDSINDLRDPEPSVQLKADFRAMLDDFKAAEKKKISGGRIWSWLLQPHLSLAYGMVILLCIGGAYLLGHSNNQGQEVQELHAQVHELKQAMMLTMLDNPLASERIKAVSYTNNIKYADKRVIDALLATLNNDPNVNVRLSTLESLAALGNYPEVRTGLIKGIMTQVSPIIQLAIADVMLKLQEKRSVGSFRELLKQKGLDDEVRQKVKETITKLI